MEQARAPPSAVRPAAHQPMAFSTSALARYALAVVATGIAFALRIAFTQVFGPPYFLFYPTVMLVAVLGGLGPGLLRS